MKKHTHLVWGFFTFQCFVFFLTFAFSCLSFSSFPLLLDFLKPKSGPSNEDIGSKSFEGGSKSVIYDLINCQNSKSPVGNLGGADCNFVIKEHALLCIAPS